MQPYYGHPTISQVHGNCKTQRCDVMCLQLRLGRILLHHDLGHDAALDFAGGCLGHIVCEIDLRYD